MAEQKTMEKKEERQQAISPLTNIIEKEKEVVLEAEMVGLTCDDIELELTGKELAILGKHRGNSVPEGYTVLYRERCPLEYRRSFTLGSVIKKESINAKYENGVLRVTLPKTKETLSKKIKIN